MQSINYTNMEEQLISLETAKLAKEKGIDKSEVLFLYYYNSSDNWKLTKESHPTKVIGGLRNSDVLAISQGLLQKWLREVHKIYIIVHLFTHDKDIIEYQNGKFYPEIVYVNLPDDEISDEDEYFNTYEEALERALVEGLTLIK